MTDPAGECDLAVIAAYDINLIDGFAEVTDLVGNGGTDTLVDVERIVFADDEFLLQGTVDGRRPSPGRAGADGGPNSRRLKSWHSSLAMMNTITLSSGRPMPTPFWGSAATTSSKAATAPTRSTARSGNDIIEGEGGNDRLLGSSGGMDAIGGGDGDETIEGGAGGDFLRGMAGIDTLSYASSAAGVTIFFGVNTIATAAVADATEDRATG